MVEFSSAAASAKLSASIEAAPRQILEIADLERLFPAGTRVYLPEIRNVPMTVQVEAARRLSRAGLIPVPHVAVRRVESRGALAQRLARLARDGGASEALVIAGDVDQPAGPFSSSMEALATGIFADQGFSTLAVAGHPTGFAHADEEGLLSALSWKNEFAARTGTNMRIVTQFGFDPRRVVAWTRRLERSGNRLPIHVGLAGPAKIGTLLKYAGLCGVGASMSVLRQNADAYAVLATSYSAEAVLGPIDAYIRSEPVSSIAMAHIYPFGGLRRTADWLVSRGTWPLPVEAPAAASDGGI
ncbi:methylenetetrahydrofolate reductase [Amorphus sp. 3PC139-8]|uniref:methylenetetrahydrofolate reductase n=1 Tax=Amorphus sp. 3PC139-8 TaxID=2735676 RepID=UPI00345CAE04